MSPLTVPPVEVGLVAFAWPLAWFAGLLLGLAFLAEVVLPALRPIVVALAPRLVYAVSFAATWLVVIATRYAGRQRP